MGEGSDDGSLEPQFELGDETLDPFAEQPAEVGDGLLIPDWDSDNTLDPFAPPAEQAPDGLLEPDFLNSYGDDLLSPDFE